VQYKVCFTFRNYFLAVLSRTINCQFSIAFDFLRPDLAIELNEARHRGT